MVSMRTREEGRGVLPLLFLLLAFALLGVPIFANAAASGTCVSQGGRFPPFSLHGKQPKKSAKGGPKELTFCRVYKDLTCCGRDNTEAARLSLRMLQVSGEPREECEELWEAAECSLCHPGIGTQPGPPSLCASFCDRLFGACQSAYFATDPLAKVFMPCSPSDALCSKGSEFATSAAEFCALAGYDVINKSETHSLHRTCFDGTLSLVGSRSHFQDHQGRSEGHSGSGRGRGSEEGGWWSQWFGSDGGVFLGNNVVWVIGGLLLLCVSWLVRWNALRGRKKRAAVLASRQMAEARAKQQALYAQGSARASNPQPQGKRK